MSFILRKASKEDKTAIENLMQFYIYDFTEFIKYDVEDNGLFAPYPHLEDYWREEINKFPYIIKEGR
jgi:predicted acetyltransferase